MNRLALSILILTAFPAAPETFGEDGSKRANFDKVLQFVRSPKGAFNNFSPFELQVYYRLLGADYHLNYVDGACEQEKWLKVVKDPAENTYARICAAYFLAGTSSEARHFLESQLNSENLRYRYNAAEALRLYIREDPENKWAIDLLLRHISAGSLDGSGVTTTPPGDYPDGDVNDIMREPLDSICRDLGSMKCQRAVPALIGVLERNPSADFAAFALGEIGDPKAIPVLMKILRNDSEVRYLEVTALGMLKAKEAVPILIARLGTPKSTFSDRDRESDFVNLGRESVLEALLAIGDRSAVKPIKDFIAAKPPKSVTAVANRVLAQLESDDPVADLIALLRKESNKYEQRNLVFALARYPKDDRVLETISAMTRESDSADMRGDAIHALGQINSRQSLLVLADLMERDFPDDLNAKTGWLIPPENFTDYFHDQIHRTLKRATGQDFPLSAAPWKRFLATYGMANDEEPTGESKPEKRM